MKTSKKYLALLLCACLLSLTACGNPGPSETPESSAQASSLPEVSAVSSAEPSVPEGVSYTFTEEELLPGGNFAMDESSIPADYSYWSEEFSLEESYPDARSRDLSGEDFSNSLDKLLVTDFDSKTIWPDTLPEGFDPRQLIDQNRNPGLGVRSLHEQGITGKGVNIGIIDDKLLTGHVEYKDRLKMYKDFYADSRNPEASMHGPAVASIAAGSTVGVAPEASLYYVAFDFEKAGENGKSLEPWIESLTYLLDLNELLPEEDKLDVISISKGWETGNEEGTEEMDALVERAAEEGVLVVTCAMDSMEQRYGFSYTGASRDPLSDPDDRSVYRPGIMIRNQYFSSPAYRGMLAVPMDFRAVASPTGTEDYVNYTDGGYSWAAPYLAGVYALARQVEPDITPEEFYQVAKGTASDIAYTDKAGAEKKLYNLIDPPALIAALQNK